MKRNTRQRALCLLLACGLLLAMTACAGQSEPGVAVNPDPGPKPVDDPAPKLGAEDLMAAIVPNPPAPAPIAPESAAAAADFALRLFRAGSEAGKNSLLSPLSVLCALAMTANGAEGETLAQMEQTLGMKREALNAYARAYLDSLSGDDTLRLANSVWFNADPRFTVEPAFLQTNADCFGAELYKAPFDDGTLADINAWVKAKTQGMIPEILDQIPEAAVMYLVNALAFAGKWETPYEAWSITNGSFHPAQGEDCPVEYMNGEENFYLEDENAVGFLKPYAGGRYAFAALLPREGLSPEDYLAGLDGTALRELLAGAQELTVYTSLPKFETAYDVELSAALKTMGMELPFDGFKADFSGLGQSAAGNIFISRVLHKTFMAVDETGTRAGAATVVEMVDMAAEPGDYREVCLDRPFVYLLIDRESLLPFFIGVMQNPAQE